MRASFFVYHNPPGEHMKIFAVILVALSALMAGCVVEPDNRSGDRDRDGIPKRADRDRDGNGVRNSQDRRPDDPRRY
jgi:hypothetical protein